MEAYDNPDILEGKCFIFFLVEESVILLRASVFPASSTFLSISFQQALHVSSLQSIFQSLTYPLDSFGIFLTGKHTENEEQGAHTEMVI
jgi:hypothetical protein